MKLRLIIFSRINYSFVFCDGSIIEFENVCTCVEIFSRLNLASFWNGMSRDQGGLRDQWCIYGWSLTSRMIETLDCKSFKKINRIRSTISLSTNQFFQNCNSNRRNMIFTSMKRRPKYWNTTSIRHSRYSLSSSHLRVIFEWIFRLQKNDDTQISLGFFRRHDQRYKNKLWVSTYYSMYIVDMMQILIVKCMKNFSLSLQSRDTSLSNKSISNDKRFLTRRRDWTSRHISSDQRHLPSLDHASSSRDTTSFFEVSVLRVVQQ